MATNAQDRKAFNLASYITCACHILISQPHSTHNYGQLECRYMPRPFLPVEWVWLAQLWERGYQSKLYCNV